jgi:spermidine synthase
MPASRFGSNVLLAVVFLTGACLLVVEVLATRMLSPYFGNTIYTFSSVIGVVLASLSVGYAVGGRMADSNPDIHVFYRIIVLGGGCILILAGVNRAVLPLFGFAFSAQTGPLFMSLLLFSVPGFLLGTLSPYVIALRQQMTTEGVGGNSGSVFFWSTLGSIAGSLLSGFVLVPHLGISTTLVGTAVLLLLLGAVGPFLHGKGQKTLPLTILFIVVSLVAGGSLLLHPISAEGLVYETEGVYQNIRVIDSLRSGQPIRVLYQDRNASSGIIPGSDELVFKYSEYFRLAPHVVGQPQRALVIGAGAFTVPKTMLHEWPDTLVDVVEIEPILEKIAQEYFGLQPDPRLQTIIADGRRYLHDTDLRYDVIFGDAYSAHHSTPPHLMTVEFFELVSDRLTDDGVLVINFIGNLEDRSPSLLFSALHTVTSVFPHTRVFAAYDESYTGPQNILVVSAKTEEGMRQLCTEAVMTPKTRILCGQEASLAQYDLTKYDLLTDDHAPVEYLATFDL